MTLYAYAAIYNLDPQGGVDAFRLVTDEAIGAYQAGDTLEGGAVQQRQSSADPGLLDHHQTEQNFVLKRTSATLNRTLDIYRRLAGGTWVSRTSTKLANADCQGLVWIGNKIYFIDRTTTPDTLMNYQVTSGGVGNSDSMGQFPADPSSGTRQGLGWNGRDFLESWIDSASVPAGYEVKAARPVNLDEGATLFTSAVEAPAGYSEIKGITFDGRNYFVLWIETGLWLDGGSAYHVQSFHPAGGITLSYARQGGSPPGTFQYAFDIDFDGKNFYVFYVTDI